MTTLPTGPDDYIECGDSKMYDVVGEDGQTRKIRIVAGPPQPGGRGGMKPEPEDTVSGGLLPPDFAYGATARIMATVLGGHDVTEAQFQADLFVDPSIAPALPPGSRLQVPMWQITGFPEGRVTLLLPEGQGDATSGGMIFVPELGGR